MEISDTSPAGRPWMKQLLDYENRAAVTSLSRHLAERPDDTTATMDRALALTQLGNRIEAEKTLAEVDLEQLSVSGRASYLLATALLKSRESGSKREVKELLIRSVESDPGLAAARLALARVLMMEDRDLDSAERHVREAQKLAPDALSVLAARILLSVQGNRFADALRAAREWLRRRPRSVRAVCLYATLAILSTPGHGILVGLCLAAGMLIPDVGPIVLSAWGAFALVSLVTVWAVAPAVAVLPFVWTIGLGIIAWLRSATE